MGIEYDFFRRAKEALDIAAVAARYGVKVDRRGKGLCPFHAEKTPSFHIDVKRQRWHCFGCDCGGDVIDLTARLFHQTQGEALRRLDEDFALGLPWGRRLSAAERERAAKAARERERAARAQARFDDWRDKAATSMALVSRTLREWQETFAPKTDEETLDARFVYALHHLARVDDLFEIANTGEASEALAAYQEIEWEKTEMEKMEKTAACPAVMPSNRTGTA